MHNRAMNQARLEAQQRKAKEISSPILAGFGSNVSDYFKVAGENIASSTNTFKPYIEQAAANLQQALAEVEARFANNSDAGKALADAAAAADTLEGKLKQLHQEAGGNASQAVADFTKRLHDQVAAMTELNGVIRQGRTAYEFATEKQKLLNEAMAAGVSDLQAIAPAVEGYIRSLQKLERQQRESGGLLGGLADLKGELPSIQEKLYEIGKNIREGIGQSMADAILDAKNLGEALRDVAKNMARMLIEYQMQKAVVGMSGSFGGWMNGMSAAKMRGSALPSTGGTGPVYAASGAFIPRGTDTVPAMLTPGESVLDRDTTSGLRRIFGGAGSVNSTPNVSISIQNNSQAQVEATPADVHFDGQRIIVGAILKDKRNNGPVSRATRGRG